MQCRCIAIAEIAEEVDLPCGATEEGLLNRIRMEARHRTAIKPQGACGKHEISRLQRAVAHRRLLDGLVIALKPCLGIDMREKLQKPVMEAHVHGQNGGDGG